MRAAVIEMLSITQRPAHPTQFRRSFEQDEWNSRTMRVKCQSPTRRAAAEDGQRRHPWPDLDAADLARPNFILSSR
jgi:hypothetical protein